jgi:hypothetical protein
MTYRAAMPTYALVIVVGLIFCLPVPGLISASAYGPAAALLSVTAILLLWARGFRLTVTDEGFAYRTLFRRSRAIRFTEVIECRLRFGYESGESHLLPSIRLSVKHRSAPEPMMINLKVFSREAVADLLKRLEPYTFES